jgi:hypothetical protein
MNHSVPARKGSVKVLLLFIYWGQFYAQYQGSVRGSVGWNSAASNAALDAAEIRPDL